MGLNVDDVFGVQGITFTCSKGSIIDAGVVVSKASIFTTKGTPYPRIVCEVLDPYNRIGRDLSLDGSEKNVTFSIKTRQGDITFRNMVFEKNTNTDNSIIPQSYPMGGTGHFQVHALTLIPQELENANKNLITHNFINQTPKQIFQTVVSQYWQSSYGVTGKVAAKPVNLNAGNLHSKEVLERLAGMYDTTDAGKNGDSLLDIYFSRVNNSYSIDPFSVSFDNGIVSSFYQYTQLAGASIPEEQRRYMIMDYKVKGFVNATGKVLNVTRHQSYNYVTGENCLPISGLKTFSLPSGERITKPDYVAKPHIVFMTNDPSNNQTPNLRLGTAAENRVIYLSDLNQCSIEFTIPPNPQLDLGMMVNLNIPDKDARNNSSLGLVSSADSSIYSIHYQLDMSGQDVTCKQTVTTLKPTQRY